MVKAVSIHRPSEITIFKVFVKLDTYISFLLGAQAAASQAIDADSEHA